MSARSATASAFLSALLLAFAASSSGAQTLTLERLGASPDLLTQADVTLCLDDVVGTVIQVRSGPPNSIVTVDLTHDVPGVLGISLSQTGPFSQSLTLPVVLDGSGNGVSAPLFLRGETVGATVLTACSPQIGCVLRPRTIAVANVASLTFEAIDSPLDGNPNAGGGQRSFPEKQTATDTVDRTRVRVRAVLSSPAPGMPVFFRSFDVDDPSTDAIPVDLNGADGDDNRGVPLAGTLSAASASTDAGGAAQVELTVTMQPGDNFRVAGACNATHLTGVAVNGTDLRDGAGNTLPTQRANVADMLTVWRRVHAEVDSMGLVTGNQVAGTIRRARPDSVTTTEIASRVEIPPGGRFETAATVLFNHRPETGHLSAMYASEIRGQRLGTEYAFARPGAYRLKAVLHGEDGWTLESGVLEIDVREPQGVDRSIWDVLRTDPELGYFIQSGGPKGPPETPRSRHLEATLEGWRALSPTAARRRASAPGSPSTVRCWKD